MVCTLAGKEIMHLSLNVFMRKIRIILYVLLLTVYCRVNAQGLPTDSKLTIRPLLQQLGEELLQGKTGSIVAINPANGELLRLVLVVGYTDIDRIKPVRSLIPYFCLEFFHRLYFCNFIVIPL